MDAKECMNPLGPDALLFFSVSERESVCVEEEEEGDSNS